MGRIENPGRYLKAAMCAHASIREQGRVPGQEARLARWDCSTPWRTPKRRLKYWGQVAEHERTGEALERVAELGAEQERIAQLPGERVVTVVQDDGDPVSFNRMLRGLSVRFPSPLEQAENERAIRDK